jgi:hypothetical protein
LWRVEFRNLTQKAPAEREQDDATVEANQKACARIARKATKNSKEATAVQVKS